MLFSSSAFIQAQHQIARWTSEEIVGGSGHVGGTIESLGSVEHRPPQKPPPSPPLPSPPPPPPQTAQRLLHSEAYGLLLDTLVSPSSSSSAAIASSLVSSMGHQLINQLQRQQIIKQQKLPAEQLPINKRGYHLFPPHTENGLDDKSTNPLNNHDDDDDDDDYDDNENVTKTDCWTKIINEAVDAQSHQHLTLLNNNDKGTIKRKIKRKPEKTLMMIREIDVSHLTNINKRPLVDKASRECTILTNNSGNDKSSTSKATLTTNESDHRRHLHLYDDDNDDGDDDDNDELNLKNITSNNTSDNENTALLPPSHFPEYKH